MTRNFSLKVTYLSDKTVQSDFFIIKIRGLMSFEHVEFSLMHCHFIYFSSDTN